VAFSFCDVDERPYLVDIERLIRLHIPRVESHPYQSPLGLPPVTDLDGKGPRSRPNLGSVNSRRGQQQRSGQQRNQPRGQSQGQHQGQKPANGSSGTASNRSSGNPARGASSSSNSSNGSGSENSGNSNANPNRRRRSRNRNRNREQGERLRSE
jgi:ATP-dependent RNA helicase RhlE